MEKTTGFGVRPENAPHHWIVRVPRDGDGTVRILEDYGAVGHDSGLFGPIPRAEIPRANWLALAAPLQEYLNGRLKSAGIKAGKFTAGDTKIERILGTEVCLLFWLIDDVDECSARDAFTSFARYSPAELHGLYYHARESTPTGMKARGWRKGLKFAFMPAYA